MELQVSLLSSDLEHLATNFRLLSKEFLILQDFVRQQYGNKYTTFYNQKKDSGFQAASSSGVQNSGGMPKPCPKSKKEGVKLQVEKRDSKISNRTSSVDAGGSDGGMSDASDASNNDNDFYFVPEDNTNDGEQDNDEEDDGYVIPADISLLYENDPNPGAGSGRNKSIVHRYFKTVKANDGVTKSECKHCGAYVSKQAQRMRNHLIKCISNAKSKSFAKIIKKEGSAPTEHEWNRKGRKSDRVRLLFTRADIGQARPRMKCKLCGTLVSNQPVRLKHHVLNRCPKRGEVNTSDYDDLPSYDETSPSNEQSVKRIKKRKRVKEAEADTSDNDTSDDDEVDRTQSRQSDIESTKTQLNEALPADCGNTPSTSGTSNANTNTPFLTICSTDLLDVACATHIGTT